MAAGTFTTSLHTTKKYRLGTQLKDASNNVWVYGKGVASTVAGDFVVFDKTWQSARLTNSSAGGPIGVAGAAITASYYGWYQVAGISSATNTNIATNASGAGLGLCASSTAGRATTTAAAGKTLFGAVAADNPASNIGPAFLNFPTFQNQSTL